MPDVFDQLEAPSTGDIFDQLGEPEEPQVMQGLVQPSPSYFTRPQVEMPTGDVLRNIESLIKVAGPRVTLPMGGELQRVREPKTFAEGMFNLLGGVGGSVISPLGAAATGVAPIKAVQPLLETGFGIPGAAGAVAGTRELIEQPPKSVGEAVERGGGVLAQGLMGAPLAVRIFRPAIKLVGGGIVEGKLGQTHNEVIADNNLTTKEIDQRGFVDDQGNFNNRAETAAQVPGIETKIEPGQAHATEVAKAQEEVPAPTPPPEEPAPTQVAPSVPEPALEKPPPTAPTEEAQPTVPAAGKAEGGVSAPPAPAIPEGGISPAKVQPQAAARKARSEVQKVARTEGQRPAKEVKNELVGRIQSELDALIEKANFKVTQNPDYPQRWSIGESQAALDVTKTKSGFTGTVFGVRGGKQTITGKSVEDLIYQTKALAAEGSGSITIDIPGDGSFTVPKNGENLLDLLKRANRISTSPGGVAAMAPKGSFPDIADQAKAAASAYGSPEKAYLSVKRQIEQLQSQEPPRTADERAELSKQIDAAEYLQRELYGNTKPGQLEAQAEAARERLATYREGAKGFEESIAKIEKVKKQTKAHKERLQDLKDRYQQNQAFIEKYEREANQFEQEAARLKAALESPSPSPSQTPSMVGMGGAVPSEFQVSPQTPTSIKNAQVDVERAKRGLPAVVQPARRAFGEVWDRAMAMIDRDPTSQDRLIESIRQKPRALNDVEDAMLLHRQIDLQNEYGKATRDLAQAFEDGRTDAVAEEKLRVARLSDDLLDIYNNGTSPVVLSLASKAWSARL